MNRTRNIYFSLAAIALLTVSSGCATWSNRTKTIVATIGTGIVVGTVASQFAPQGEQPVAHAMIWGGPSAAAAGIISLFIFDEEKRSTEFERQMGVLKKELDSLRGESTGSSQPTLLYETSAPFGEAVPNEYKKLVSPGQWSVYRLNQWVSQGENTLIHQDRMLKLIPPVLSPKKDSHSDFAEPQVGSSQ